MKEQIIKLEMNSPRKKTQHEKSLHEKSLGVGKHLPPYGLGALEVWKQTSRVWKP